MFEFFRTRLPLLTQTDLEIAQFGVEFLCSLNVAEGRLLNGFSQLARSQI